MLNGKLALHDIRDAEAFAHAVARRHADRLQPHETEDLTAYLIAELWILAERYDHDPEKGGSFAAQATVRLPQRAHDWTRSHFGRTTWRFNGRTHTRTIPNVVSLEQELHGSRTRGDSPSQGGDRYSERLLRALPPASGDPATDSDPDLTRLLRTRGSTEAWDNHPDRPRMPRRTAA